MKNYQCIIFDMDGTLYAYNKQCRVIYKNMAVNLINKHYGMSLEDAEAKFLKLRDKEERECNQKVANTLVLLKNFNKIEFDDVENEVDSIFNVEEVLSYDEKAFTAVQSVCNNYKTILYTMNNIKTTNRTLDTIGMATLFPKEKRFSFSTMGKLELPRAERLTYIKPGLKGYELVVERNSIDPKHCLMVGDSQKSDIDPAKALGMDGYLIKKFEDLYELPNWLEI